MAKRAKTIDLLKVGDLLQEHITPALCRTVFGAVRTTERQRAWTLEASIRFWTAVVLRASKALSQALVDSLEGRDPMYPRIEASTEAFFQRCRDLRPAFFDVLAPGRLTAEQALDLYSYRWSVEPMFFDLKEVLNLNRLYAANPNAVATQVYAAAIVYNALRVAQSEGAEQVGWAPEQLSPAKFYPKVARATYLYLHRQQWEREIRTRYRHLHLRRVGGRRRWVRASPEPVQVNTEPTTAGCAGSVSRAVTGSRSLMCAVVDGSRSYLSGDVIDSRC
jgi:hypothetical protein